MPSDQIELIDAITQTAEGQSGQRFRDGSLTAAEQKELWDDEIASVFKGFLSPKSARVRALQEKKDAQFTLLADAWRKLRIQLYERRIAGRLFLESGEDVDLPFYCWISPLNDSSWKDGTMKLVLLDGRAISGLARLREKDAHDLLSGSGERATAHSLVDAADVRPSLKKSKAKAGRKPYPWSEFQTEALRKLDYEGGVSAANGFIQADLVRHMTEWCNKSWTREPGDTVIRQQCAKAVHSDAQKRATGQR